MVLKLSRSHFVGLFSATFLIFNSMIGTRWVVVNPWNWQWTQTDHLWNRIYATPSNILRSSGSVGVSLIMWLVGALIAACGTTVYIEFGMVCFFVFLLNPIFRPYNFKGLPRSGGEKNYCTISINSANMWLFHIFEKSQKIGKIEEKLFLGSEKNGWDRGRLN